MFRDFEAIITRFQINPTNAILYYVILIFAILISLILHENAHGFVALWCGDPTAKMLGRLTLNPAKHLDPLGTVSMILFRFGWAKPVPINPRNFRHQRLGFILVSLAGIAMNLILFIMFLAMSVLLNRVLWNDHIVFSPSVYYDVPYYAVNTGIMDFSFCRKEFYMLHPGILSEYMRIPAFIYLQFFFQVVAQINLYLALFNFLPIPPLDGFRFIQGMSNGKIRLTRQVLNIIQIVTIILLLTGIISTLLGYVYEPIYNGLKSLFLRIFG